MNMFKRVCHVLMSITQLAYIWHVCLVLHLDLLTSMLLFLLVLHPEIESL